MIQIRRAGERHHARRKKQDVWRTFHADDPADALAGGFGALVILDEHRLAPGARIAHQALADAEIITYVCGGALAFEDSTGRAGVVQVGEIQRMGKRRGTHYRAANASRSDPAHVFQMWLLSSELGIAPSHEQKLLYSAERRGVLCIVASPHGRGGSLCIQQDASIYSAILEPGQHVVHELTRGRSAWLQLVYGDARLGDVVLTSGDGAGITLERAVSLTARAETELLLVDLPTH